MTRVPGDIVYQGLPNNEQLFVTASEAVAAAGRLSSILFHSWSQGVRGIQGR